MSVNSALSFTYQKVSAHYSCTVGWCGSKTQRQETWQTIAQNVDLYVLINAIVLVFTFMEPFGRNLNSKFCSSMEFWLSSRKLHLKMSKNQENFD